MRLTLSPICINYYILKTNSVFLDKRYMVGGLKTDAGKNRQIPISGKIVPLDDI